MKNKAFYVTNQRKIELTVVLNYTLSTMWLQLISHVKA